MAKNSLHLKLWLIAKGKRSRRLPLFVIAKTGRRLTSNKFRRNWRRDKLGTRLMRQRLRKR